MTTVALPPFLCTLPTSNSTSTTPPTSSTASTTATVPPFYYRITARPSKRKQSIWEMTKERERERKVRKMQEERGWESSEEEEDVTAIGLLQRSADSVSDESDESEGDEVMVGEGEEQEILLSATDVKQNGLQEKIVDDFEALKATVPEALASVTNASIRGFYRLAVRTIDAYSAGLRYGTEEFKQNVYKSHRQVEDKSKW